MGKTENRLGIGLVGSGFMGKAHAFAFNCVAQVFELPLRPELAVLADQNEGVATKAAERLGFARASGDWQKLVEDPAVHVVAITAPNSLHKPIALAALAAGKHVYCEKPLAPTLADARDMMKAAQDSGRVTMVGFQYLKNPMVALAGNIVQSGEIGEVVAFRGIHAEDYMMDPESPFSFRNEAVGGGVLLDLGSHIVAMARHLLGPITEVSAIHRTVHATRPSPQGPRNVETDDHAYLLCGFASGALGSLAASWVTPGRKMQLEFELIGTKGSLVFSQERFNELKLYTAGASKDRDGFRTIVSSPATPPYGSFCPAPGHQLGFNDLKTVEVATLINAIAGGTAASPDFSEAFEIQRVIEAAIRSGRERDWIEVDRM